MSALWERLGDGCISVEDDFEISAALPRSEHRSNIDTKGTTITAAFPREGGEYSFSGTDELLLPQRDLPLFQS